MERGEGGVITNTHTGDGIYIFYTTYSLFMGALHSWHIMIMNGA